MTLTEIINKLNTIHNGSWFNIKYQSKPTVKAAFKKEGISVVKMSENLVRTGIAYNNIGAVIEKKSAEDYVAPTVQRENNNEWIVPNKIMFNTKTQKYSARLGFCNGHKAKVIYKAYNAEGNEIPFDKDYVIDSYWNKGSEEPTVMNIGIDNIIEIG